MQETVRAKSELILSPLPNVVAIVLEFASTMCKKHIVCPLAEFQAIASRNL